MIVLGCRRKDKLEIVQRYIREREIARVVVLSPAAFRFQHPDAWEWVDYPQIIKYRWFYRLLQEINHDTLVVVNECLRTQNRSDLTYNCIRHYLQQTKHQIVFQYLPQIDTFADFMTLVDWDTRSRWKGQLFSAAMLDGLDVCVSRVPLVWSEQGVEVTNAVRDEYQRTRDKLFSGIGSKDPHTIPRNLYLVTGRTKCQAIDQGGAFVGRNNRFKLLRMATYGDGDFGSEPRVVFEFPHNFIEFADYLAISEQTEIVALTTPLRCDQWYWSRYQDWWGRIQDAYATISG